MHVLSGMSHPKAWHLRYRVHLAVKHVQTNMQASQSAQLPLLVLALLLLSKHASTQACTKTALWVTNLHAGCHL